MQVIRVEDGIECELVRSQPTLVGGPYEITVISDVPADSVTMHNKLVLAPVNVDDVIELTEQRRDVAGQDDDGSLNGEDYTETRLVSEWEATR